MKKSKKTVYRVGYGNWDNKKGYSNSKDFYSYDKAMSFVWKLYRKGISAGLWWSQ